MKEWITDLLVDEAMRFILRIYRLLFNLWLYLFIAVNCLLGAVPVYYLWNWLMPEIFGLKSINFWQAWGLLFLCSFLFRMSSSISYEKSKEKEILDREKENAPYSSINSIEKNISRGKYSKGK
jgi:hypothetical protein